MREITLGVRRRKPPSGNTIERKSARIGYVRARIDVHIAGGWPTAMGAYPPTHGRASALDTASARGRAFGSRTRPFGISPGARTCQEGET